MHESIENLPVILEGPGTTVRALRDMGGMAVAHLELPAGTDIGPLLEGLPNDRCPSPHWGYVIKGKMTITYLDGNSEVLEAGQVFNISPGHTATVQEDVAFVELSPVGEFAPVVDHILAASAG